MASAAAPKAPSGPRPPTRGPAAGARPPTRSGAKAKAKAAQPDAPPPASPASQTQRKTSIPVEGKRFSRAYTKDVEDVVDRLFNLSDVDCSGVIEFGEFLAHHRAITCDFAGPQETNAKVEKRFRELDKDNSLSLDRDEFRMYMDGVLSLLGKRRFKEICDAMYQEMLEQVAGKKGCDPATSGRLVDKARGANWILPDTEQVLLQMIHKKADINFTDETGTTALTYVVDKCENAFVAQLLSARADPSLHNKEFDCPAFRAARGRSIENLRLLLLPDAKLIPVDTQAQVQVSQPLVREIASMSAADVATAIKKGADLNFRDVNGWTPLTAAVFWGKVDCMEAMLRTMATHAQVKLKLDMHNARGRAAIHIAARKGNREMIEQLIKARCPVDLQDSEGWTALHHAVFNSMEDCINGLLDRAANLQVQGKGGLTPVMLAKMPECSGKLTEKCLKSLGVPEELAFSKALLPILKDDNTKVFDKLEAIFSLPRIGRNAFNLRLYEQCFDCRHGPNKVRLQKLWEALAMPIMQRLVTQETDLCHVPGRCPIERRADNDQRMREQMSFLRQWFADTRGPRKDGNWKYDNREAYGDELQKVMAEELAKFRAEFERAYEALPSQTGGSDLVNRPAVEETDCAFNSQIQAHPLLPWLQHLDVAVAFEALRQVGAAGMGGDDVVSVLSFVDLVENNSDFDTGKGFWKNVYKLWLEAFAQVVNADFQKRIQGLVTRFAEENVKDNNTISFRRCERKSYERMHVREKLLGDSSHETYAGRTAAGQVLDVVRCSVTVSSPILACRLMDEVFAPLTLHRDKLQITKIINRFSKETSPDELKGYRNIELSLAYDGGVKPSACGRKDLSLHVRIIGEVQILLEDFLSVRERRDILFKASRGEFDWPDVCDDHDAHKDEDVWQ